MTAGDSPNDLLDRRDQLLDQLSGFGQVSVEQLDSGSIERVLRRRPPARPTRSSTTRPPPGPARRPATLVARRPSSAACSTAGKPGGTLDGYLRDARLDRRTSLPTSVNAPTAARFFTLRHAAPAATLARRSAPIQAAPTQRSPRAPAPRAPTTSRCAVSQLRGNARDRRRLPRVRRAGRRRRQRGRRASRPTPRRSPTRSRTAARASPASRSTRR